MREASIETALPVVTISNGNRLLNDSVYRGQYIESLIEIVLVNISISNNQPKLCRLVT
jgi:hypothetical protein